MHCADLPTTMKDRKTRSNVLDEDITLMTLHLELAPLISLGAGIGIPVFPKLLNYIVAGYLIILGVLRLLGHTL